MGIAALLFTLIGLIWLFLMSLQNDGPQIRQSDVKGWIDPELTHERVLELMEQYGTLKPRGVIEKVKEAISVFFKPGEPQTFEEYAGQEHILEYLKDAVRALAPNERAIEPQLFLGMAGMGKTLLAKVVANELNLRAERLELPSSSFLEIFPADLPDVAALDDVLRRVVDTPGCVMFIDEIHDLQSSHTRKLYLVLEEGRYQFRGEPQPVQLPPVTLLGATTDAGLMHAALKRRWIRHMFRPATPEQLLGYIIRRGFPIAEPVAWRIVERTRYSGAPWEGLELYRIAVTAAKARGSGDIEDADVDRAFEMQQIDDFGLRWIDRRVIEVLFTQPKFVGKSKDLVCYAASEVNVCVLSGIDKEEYRQAVRPRLMSRGLLALRPYYGQSLTDKTIELYGHLLR